MDSTELRWKRNFKLAENFYQQHGDLFIAYGYKVNGVNLGQWISNLRRNYKKGRISQEKIDQLNSIGMVWDAYTTRWNKKYNLAKQYSQQHGNLLIPNRREVNNVSIGKWIHDQRQGYKGIDNRKITKEKVDKLNSIGMVWNAKQSN